VVPHQGREFLLVSLLRFEFHDDADLRHALSPSCSG
jgi:hypothetical protein